MAKLQCINTCYVPTGDKPKKGKSQVVERYEDVDGENIWEVEDDRVDEFLATNNFVLVAE